MLLLRDVRNVPSLNSFAFGKTTRQNKYDNGTPSTPSKSKLSLRLLARPDSDDSPERPETVPTTKGEETSGPVMSMVV